MQLTNEIAKTLKPGTKVTACMSDAALIKGQEYTIQSVGNTSSNNVGFHLEETHRFHFAAKFSLSIFQAAECAR